MMTLTVFHVIDAKIITLNLAKTLSSVAVNTDSLNWYLVQLLDSCDFQVYGERFILDEILRPCELILLPLSFDVIHLRLQNGMVTKHWSNLFFLVN